MNSNFDDNYSSSDIDFSFGPVFLKCLICLDSPRIIFKKKNNTIVIKAYCLSHKEKNEKDIYSLNEFINKYEMFESEEKILLEEEENKKEINLSSGRILPYDSEISIEEKKKTRKSLNICEKHESQYLQIHENKEIPLCQFCYCENFKNHNLIQRRIIGKRFEEIPDLIHKVNAKILYIEKNIQKAKNHLNNICYIKNKDKKVESAIKKYFEINNNLLIIVTMILDTYKYSKEHNAITYSMAKNVSEIVFNFSPLPDYSNDDDNESKKKLLNYLTNLNNYIINHHLERISSIKPNSNQKITRIIKLNDNKLCVGVDHLLYIIELKNSQFFTKMIINRPHKDRIWDIILLENGNIATISRDNICSFIKINENNFEIKGTIKKQIVNKEKFNSFLFLSDQYVAIHTWHNLLIFRIPEEGEVENKEIIERVYSDSDSNIDTYAGLILKNIEGNDVYFYSVLSGQNIINLWKFNIETKELSEPFSINYKTRMYYSGFSGSLCKYNEECFFVGGYEMYGYYLISYNDLEEIFHDIPNYNHFQSICVMPDETFVCGENYGNKKFYLRRYQIINDKSFLVDNIIEGDDKESPKKNPITIICLDNSNIVVGDYDGSISLWG